MARFLNPSAIVSLSIAILGSSWAWFGTDEWEQKMEDVGTYRNLPRPVGLGSRQLGDVGRQRAARTWNGLCVAIQAMRKIVAF
jgi:hypothetical protein